MQIIKNRYIYLITNYGNIFSNFVRSKVITVDDKDLLWINEEIKCKIKSKNKIF